MSQSDNPASQTPPEPPPPRAGQAPPATVPCQGAPAGFRARLGCYLRRCATIRDYPSRVECALAGLACVAIVLLVWHVLTVGEPEQRIIDSYTLPSLGETARSFHSLWFDRALARSAFSSLERVLGGFLLAIAVGVPLGVAAGAFKRLYAFLKPLSIFGRNIPIAALIPLTLIWFGLGEAQKVMFIFLAAAPFIFFDSASAVDSVPDIYLDTAYTLGARFTPRRGLAWAGLIALAYGLVFGLAYLAVAEDPGTAEADAALRVAWNRELAKVAGVGFVLGFLLWFPIVAFQSVRKVLFALALPEIVNSLRLLFGLAFGYIMLAEVINAEHGLGAIIITSQRRGPREHIYLALIIIAVLAFVIDRGILAAQRRLFPYRELGAK